MTEVLICYTTVAVVMARATYDRDHAGEVWFFSLIWPILALIGLGHVVCCGVLFVVCLPFRVAASLRPPAETRTHPQATIGVTKF